MIAKISSASSLYQPKIVILFLSVIYIFTRLYQLMSLPIFNDEAIYIRWAQMILEHPSNLFISLTDGKQPLIIWVIAFFLKFLYDPLLSGRVTGVFFGFLTFLGLLLLVRLVFQNWIIAYITSFLYILFPMALVYDRMALYESAIASATVYSIIALFYFMKKPSLLRAFLLGAAWGIGLLIKSNGFFTLFLSLLLVPIIISKKTRKKMRLERMFFYLFIAISLSYLCYSFLRFSPHFSEISTKNAVFAYHFSELMPYGAFSKWPQNLLRILQWIGMYLTIPLSILTLFSLAFAKPYKKQLIIFSFLSIIPILFISLFGRILNPRYIFPAIIFFLPLASLTITQIFLQASRRALFCIILSLGFFLLVRVDYTLLTMFPEAPIPEDDLVQYSNGWPAGGGMKEITAFLENEGRKRNVMVFSEGIYGSLPTTVLQIYLGHEQNITLTAFDPSDTTLTTQLSEKKKQGDVYIVLNQLQMPKSSWHAKEIASYQKGNSQFFSHLYRVK